MLRQSRTRLQPPRPKMFFVLSSRNSFLPFRAIYFSAAHTGSRFALFRKPKSPHRARLCPRAHVEAHRAAAPVEQVRHPAYAERRVEERRVHGGSRPACQEKSLKESVSGIKKDALPRRMAQECVLLSVSVSEKNQLGYCTPPCIFRKGYAFFKVGLRR